MLIYLIEFILFCIIILYPLGKVSVDSLKFRLPLWEDFLISLNIGIVVFTSIIFLLWRLGLYQLTLAIISLPVFYMGYKLVRFARSNNFNIASSISLPLIITLLFCTVIQSLVTFQAGDIIEGGLKLPLAHGVDGMSYISLVNSLQRSIPPKNPSYSGELVQNYHYLSYVFIAAVQYITKIPILILNFKFVSSLFALLFTSTAYLIIKNFIKSKTITYLGIMFITFSSNFYYLIGFLYPSAYITPSVFWVDEYTTRMVNGQLIFSYVVLLTILFLIFSYKNLNNWKFVILTSMLIGSLIEIKAFSSVIILGALFLFTILRAIRGSYQYVRLLVGGILGTTLFYLSFSTSIQSILLISPFWFIKNMFETQDHLNFVTWELKRQTYLKEANYLRIIQLYTEGVFIFLISNLGGRLLGLLSILDKNDDRKSEIIRIITLIGFIGIILPMIFVVKGTAWNSIQFFYYAILFFGFLTIFYLDKIYFARKIFAFSLLTIIWGSLIPGVIYASYSYINSYKTYSVSSSVTEALIFLSHQEEGVVLIDPYYYNNALVSAISKKNAFFADEMMLNVQLISYQDRKQQVNKFFTSDISGQDKYKKDLLTKNKIEYIFASSKGEYELSSLVDMKQIFKNNEILVYKLK